MLNEKTLKKYALYLLLILLASSLFLNIYGAIFISPVMRTETETKEVLDATQKFSLSAHVLKNSFYIIDSNLDLPSENVSFYANGDYATVHNSEGFISKSANASYINITMYFKVPKNWSRLVIFYEYGFSTMGDINVDGIGPGNVNTTIHYKFNLYNTSGKLHFSYSVPKYFFIVDRDCSFLIKKYYTSTFTQNNASNYDIPIGKPTVFVLNYYIHDIVSVPFADPSRNFSVHLMFGLGYKVFKNESVVVTYTQTPDLRVFLQVNLFFVGLAVVVVVVTTIATKNTK